MDTIGLRVAVGIAAGQRTTVLDYASREAESAGCGIKIVHAYTVPPSAMGPIYGLDVSEAYRAAGQKVLAAAMRHLSETANTAPVECVLTRGFAPSVLEFESRSSRLMIIGPDESKPWYIRLFEGKSARHLAEHAECPIVVVPDTWEESRDTAPIVVMVDGETTAHGPLSFGFQIASARHVELQVLHVAADTRKDLDTLWQAIRRVVDSWYDAHPDVPGRSQVVTGEVHEQAIRAANGAGLLVLGRPHERRVTSVLMDSLAQEIISGSDCPVAVVPAGYRG